MDIFIFIFYWVEFVDAEDSAEIIGDQLKYKRWSRKPKIQSDHK